MASTVNCFQPLNNCWKVLVLSGLGLVVGVEASVFVTSVQLGRGGGQKGVKGSGYIRLHVCLVFAKRREEGLEGWRELALQGSRVRSLGVIPNFEGRVLRMVLERRKLVSAFMLC